MYVVVALMLLVSYLTVGQIPDVYSMYCIYTLLSIVAG